MELEISKIYEGKVLKIFKTYALIDVEGISGIVHISEISDYHISSITNYLTVGKKYNFILISKDNGKYAFSYKKINAKLLKIRSTIIPTISGYKNVYNKMMNALNKE
ncbi:MAG: hypothetical protein Ta2E_04890 [Mycoplasmoidaceae bacterium]|nr:MAG: hypothetical protein Ta2E_04890 [Mycoplasmoidaceae bacterium]